LTKLFNFQDEEVAECGHCFLVDGYLQAALESDSEEELRAVLHNLSEDSFQNGYDVSLSDDIEITTKLLHGTLEEE